MHLSVVTFKGAFARSGKRLVYILVHLEQRLEKIVDVQLLQDPCLVDCFHGLDVAASQGHGERVPLMHARVDGSRSASTESAGGELLMLAWMAGTELGQSASGVSVSELNPCITRCTSLQTDSTVPFDQGA